MPLNFLCGMRESRPANTSLYPRYPLSSANAVERVAADPRGLGSGRFDQGTKWLPVKTISLSPAPLHLPWRTIVWPVCIKTRSLFSAIFATSV